MDRRDAEQKTELGRYKSDTMKEPHGDTDGVKKRKNLKRTVTVEVLSAVPS